MPSTLIITNDFPPRIGGIESFISEVCTLLDHDVVVYASGSAGAAASDLDRPFRVIRDGPVPPHRRSPASHRRPGVGQQLELRHGWSSVRRHPSVYWPRHCVVLV